jgi:hypothetical protein
MRFGPYRLVAPISEVSQGFIPKSVPKSGLLACTGRDAVERLQHGLEVLALTSTGAKSRSSRTWPVGR